VPIILSVLALIAAVAGGFVAYRRRKGREDKDAKVKEAELREEQIVKEAVKMLKKDQKKWDAKKPYFYFVKAQYVREFKLSTVDAEAAAKDAAATDAYAVKSLPMMQMLQKDGVLEALNIDLAQAFRGTGGIDKILFVSHRWEERGQPDKSGTQLRAIQQHLKRKSAKNIEYVWFDYWCMPQRGITRDTRTIEERALMKVMLESMTYLYASAQVLILLDRQYLGRFWTLTEAWCSMQMADAKVGLRPAKGEEEGVDEERFTIENIHGANDDLSRHLFDKKTMTNQEIAEDLGRADVFVTNDSDKSTILPIIKNMNVMIKELMQGMEQNADDVGLAGEQPAFTPVENFMAENRAEMPREPARSRPFSFSTVKVAPTAEC